MVHPLVRCDLCLIFGSVVDMQSFYIDCCQNLENEDENNCHGEIKVMHVLCMCMCMICGHSLASVFGTKILEWTNRSTS